MNYAIILSGGTGSRLTGLDVPKQYYQVDGRSILSYCIGTVSALERVDRYVIVAAMQWRDTISGEMALLARTCPSVTDKFHGFADPGENRQESILHGLNVLKQIAKEEDLVLIQDAARPLTSGELIENCFAAAGRADADGAMPV